MAAAPLSVMQPFVLEGLLVVELVMVPLGSGRSRSLAMATAEIVEGTVVFGEGPKRTSRPGDNVNIDGTVLPVSFGRWSMLVARCLFGSVGDVDDEAGQAKGILRGFRVSPGCGRNIGNVVALVVEDRGTTPPVVIPSLLLSSLWLVPLVLTWFVSRGDFERRKIRCGGEDGDNDRDASPLSWLLSSLLSLSRLLNCVSCSSCFPWPWEWADDSNAPSNHADKSSSSGPPLLLLQLQLSFLSVEEEAEEISLRSSSSSSSSSSSLSECNRSAHFESFSS